MRPCRLALTCPQQPLPHRLQVSKLVQGGDADRIHSDPYIGALL